MRQPSKSQSDRLTLITDAKDLARVVQRVSDRGKCGLDTESASFHRYIDRVYLIQLSTEDQTAIVDPLEVQDLAALGKLLSNPKVEIVIHDADYDLRTLDRDYGFRAKNLFDTKVAAELLGEPGVGLGALLQKYFGVEVDKRFQRADWSRRPLTEEMLSYAAADTEYLIPLRDELASQLERAGRTAWAREEFRRLEEVRWTASSEDGRAFLKLKGAKALKTESLGVLQSLYRWREGKARAHDRAPFRIMGNNALLSLAKHAPTSSGRLAQTPGVPRSAVKRYGPELIAAIKEGRAKSPDQVPQPERARRRRHDPTVDSIMGKLKQLRNRRAEEIGIPPGLLCPNGTLVEVARRGPQHQEELSEIPDLRGWQLEAMGPRDVLEIIRSARRADPRR